MFRAANNVPLVSDSKRRIVLGLLRKPMHGYEIARDCDVPLTSIYQHLKVLVREGHIRAEGQGRRKVYRLTRRGKHLAKALE